MFDNFRFEKLHGLSIFCGPDGKTYKGEKCLLCVNKRVAWNVYKKKKKVESTMTRRWIIVSQRQRKKLTDNH